MQMIFDGHNDVLNKLVKAGGASGAGEFLTGMDGQLDLAKARAGGFGGGFFAMWARSPGVLGGDMPQSAPYDVPLPQPLALADARATIDEQAEILTHLQQLGALRICTAVDQIEAARRDGILAAIMHLEGAEPIAADLDGLESLVAKGLRSLGPVWSRPNVFAEGVPFRFPSDGDIGGGLTQAGRALVARCGELGVMVDLSHLNMAGFRDVAEISGKPLVATHSNAHAVTPHARNLTDAQLDRIAASGGLAGLNFATIFLRPDGLDNDDTSEAMVMAHLDHLLDRLGEEGVGIGSDFDGCTPPKWLNRADKLPALVAAMERHGFRAKLIERICWGNWMRVLRETWGG